MSGGFGIGRVPQDVDPTREGLAEVEAARIVAERAAPPAPREEVRCPRCGETGEAGAYPFSTYGHTHNARRGTQVCDDCGA